MNYSLLLIATALSAYYLLTSSSERKMPSPIDAIRVLIQKRKQARKATPVPSTPPPVPASPTPVIQLKQEIVKPFFDAIGARNRDAVQRSFVSFPQNKDAFAAYINAQDELGNSALSRAAHLGYTDIVELLLLNGAHLFIKNNSGQTPLHRAPTPDTIRILIGYGASPHAIDHHGNTPLHLAAQDTQKSSAIITTLLQMDANPTTQNKDGNTPLMVAILTQQAEKARILAEIPDTVDMANLQGQSPRTFMKPLPPPQQVAHTTTPTRGRSS